MPDIREEFTLPLCEWYDLRRELLRWSHWHNSKCGKEAALRLGTIFGEVGLGDHEDKLTISFPPEEARIVYGLIGPIESPAPPGLRKKPGVETDGGCGEPTCRDCYEPIPRYSVEPGRHIHRDGEPFIFIGRCQFPHVSPSEVDTLTHTICRFLNEREDFRAG